MLVRQTNEQQLETWGFLISVELLKNGNATPAQIADKFADAPRWIEGVGEVSVDCLGIVDAELPDKLGEAWFDDVAITSKEGT